MTTMEDVLLSFFNRDLRAPDLSVTALPEALERAREVLPSALPAEGIGEKGALRWWSNIVVRQDIDANLATACVQLLSE
jgi:hypothetical protein